MATSPRRRENFSPFRPLRFSKQNTTGRAAHPPLLYQQPALLYDGEGRAARSFRTHAPVRCALLRLRGRPWAPIGPSGPCVGRARNLRPRPGDTWTGALDAVGTSRTNAHRALHFLGARQSASDATITPLICGPRKTVPHQSLSPVSPAGSGQRCLRPPRRTVS